MDWRLDVRHHLRMPPAIGWMVGWTLAMGGAGMAMLVLETAGGGRWPAVATLAVAGIGGMAYGALEAARRRNPGDEKAARRHAKAWTLAGVFAFAIFAISLPAVEAPMPLTNGDRYAQGARLLVWFGAVGSFLAVAAETGWRLRIGAFVRGVIAAVVWAPLMLFCGAVGVLGIYFGGPLLSDGTGWSSPVIAGLLSGAVSGAFLGVCGEAVNRRTLKRAT